ncbi:MAG: hypothetical protein WCB79_10590 [Halobacteriota archaeon]
MLCHQKGTYLLISLGGVDWKHYKHPLPEHVYGIYKEVYGIYKEYWGKVDVRI